MKASALFVRKLRDLDRELGATLPRVAHGENGAAHPSDGKDDAASERAKHAADDEAIHDFRVAMRRIRTLLKLGRPLFGRFHADAVRRAFAEVMRATGALRDEEVLEDTLGDLELGSSELDAWIARRRGRERALRRAVVARVKRGEVTAARAMLKALLTLPVDPDRERDLLRLATRCVERARKRVDALKGVDVTDVTGMHDLRIAYKELRYAAELLAEGLPVELAEAAPGAAKFQKRLGEIHDLDVAIATIGRTRGLSEETREAALARLREKRQRQVAKFQAEGGPSLDDPLLFI